VATLDPQGRPDSGMGVDPITGSPTGGYTGGEASTNWNRSEPTFDPWNYRPDAGWTTDQDMVGYKVEATDGGIGKIDEASHAMNESYLVVDTGPWIFGKKVMLPAGTVTRVDHADRKVYVDRTKDQIKASPEFDQDTYAQQQYRDKIGGYYNDTYRMP
jgi:hypothetical protein